MTRPVRVTHLITGLEIGGAERTLARLVGSMDPARVKSTVVTLTTRGALADYVERQGARVINLNTRRGVIGPAALWRLVRVLRRERPDVLQTWLYHADFAGLLAGPLAGVPVVWNLRCAELDRADHSRLLMPILKTLAWFSNAPAAIVCNSEAGRRAHEALGYRGRRWALIPNGFDVDALTPNRESCDALRREIGLCGCAMLVGIIARVHVMKDHATFLRAVAIVAESRPDVHFLLVGRGVRDSAELTELIDSLGLTARVCRLDERPDISTVLGTLDVVVSSSYSEAFPNVVAEAMACGVPCVVTDAGDSAAIAGDTGIVVPIRDPEALARGILEMLSLDVDARRGRGSEARARIQANYALPDIARRYEALYQELAASVAD